jgi:antitoxin CptB
MSDGEWGMIEGGDGLPITHHPSPITDLNRLRWHSRRGMLELDILLVRFWEKHGAALESTEAAELEKLLEKEDNDLLELILDDRRPADADNARILQLLRES